MIKKLFLFTFLSLFLISCSNKDISINTTVLEKDDKYEELKNRFYTFWKARKNSDTKTMYDIEAPHFKYLNKYDKYDSYYKLKLNKFNISILSIREKNSVFFVEVKMEVNDRVVKYLDIWLNIDSKFYHLTKNFIFFQE